MNMLKTLRKHTIPALGIVGLLSVSVAPGQSHNGSSPWPPPRANSTRFVVDTGSGLDTGCTYRNGGPLVIHVPVTLAYNQVISTLRQNGLVDSTVKLIMPAWDVDYDAGTSCSGVSERDQVYFNGHLVPGSYLTGANNTWVQNTFDIPIEWVKFPDPAPQGSTVTPEDNVIEIHIDTANTVDECWCVAIDWAALDVSSIPLPNIFVHGIFRNLGNPWGNFTQWCNEKGLVADGSLNMGDLDSIGNNAAKIQQKVDAVCTQYGVQQVNLICHSKGGIDSREYSELLADDKVYQLVQLGTPNAGSPLADAVQIGIFRGGGVWGGLLINGFISLFEGPAGIQLTTPYMAGYNAFHGHNPKVSYYALAGYYHPGTGWFDDLLEKFLISIVGPGDTIVPLNSAYAMPFITGLPAVQTSGSNKQATHTSMNGSPLFFDNILPYMQRRVQSKNVALDPFSGGVTLLSTSGLIPLGGAVTNQVAVDQPLALTFVVMYPTGQVALTLVAPNGQRFNETNSVGNTNLAFGTQPFAGGMIALAAVSTPAVGSWSIEAALTDAPTGTNQEPYLLLVTSSGNTATMTVSAHPTSAVTNHPVSIIATFADGTNAVTNVTVTATVEAPDGSRSDFTLSDGGTNGDPVAGDGIYTGTFSNTVLTGSYRVLVSASRPAGGGLPPISRDGFTLFSISTQRIGLRAAISDHGEDTDANGLYNWLVVDVGLSVTNPGTYLLRGELSDGNGNIHVASTRNDFGVGLTNVLMRFYGNAIRSNQVNGPYTLRSFRIAAEEGTAILPQLDVSDLYNTAAYSYLQFEGAQLALATPPEVSAVDLNTNGLFDQLRVLINLESAVGGSFNGSLRLVDTHSSLIGVASLNTTLTTGTNLVTFVFAGTDIGKHGVDGPYLVKDLLLYGAGGTSIALSDVVTTTNYSAAQFEGYTGAATRVAIVSQILSTNIDRQTGLFYQQVVLTNSGMSTVNGLRISATNLPSGFWFVSATGTNAGVPFVEFSDSLAPGQVLTLTLAYYSNTRRAPTGVGVSIDVVTITPPTPSAGQTLAVRRAFSRPDGKMAVEFNSLRDRLYVIEYSSDLATWNEARPAVIGTGASMIWVDAGPPTTASSPSGNRYYRLILLPQ